MKHDVDFIGGKCNEGVWNRVRLRLVESDGFHHLQRGRDGIGSSVDRWMGFAGKPVRGLKEIELQRFQSGRVQALFAEPIPNVLIHLAQQIAYR